MTWTLVPKADSWALLSPLEAELEGAFCLFNKYPRGFWGTLKSESHCYREQLKTWGLDVGRALGILLKCRCDLSGLGQGLGICTFHKLLSDGDAAGPGPHFQEQEVRSVVLSGRWFCVPCPLPCSGDIWQWAETMGGGEWRMWLVTAG